MKKAVSDLTHMNETLTKEFKNSSEKESQHQKEYNYLMDKVNYLLKTFIIWKFLSTDRIVR